MNPTFYSENDIRLYHHGILGMKWGVRRYQNKDGSLTTAGRSHYGRGPSKLNDIASNFSKKRSERAATNKEISEFKKNRKFRDKLHDSMFGTGYNYKRNKNSDKSKERAAIYKNNLKRYHTEGANKIEYLIDKRGLSRNAATKMVQRELNRNTALLGAGVAGYLFVELGGAGMIDNAVRIGQQRIMANNIMMTKYADAVGGLNTVKGGLAGPSTTIKALKRGKKILSKMP